MKVKELVRQLLMVPNRELNVKTFTCTCDCEECCECSYDLAKENGEDVVTVDGEYYTPINSVGLDTDANGIDFIVVG